MTNEALTTKERIKDRLGITVTSFDDLLDNLILAVSGRIRRMTGRNFLQATYTSELYDGSDPVYGSPRDNLILKNAPVQAISSIEYKSGLNASPTWTAFSVEDYDVDYDLGLVYFYCALPAGRRNIRVTYTAGYSGYAIGLRNIWTFNVTPTGTVNGVNLDFTLPEAADAIIVFADGIRIAAANYSFTPGASTFTMASGYAPATTIAVDYQQAGEASDDPTLPEEIVEVCEEAVSRIFKRRESEGRASESFQESSITWNKAVFTDEDLATIKNYRRGQYL